MDPWEKAVRTALAERRNRLEEISQEVTNLERQMDACQQRLASLLANRSSVETETSLLYAIVERAISGTRPAMDESAPIVRLQSGLPSTEMAPSAPSYPPAAPPRSKVPTMLDVLRSFGHTGASIKTLADACTAAGIHLKHGWFSCYLSQKKKQGEVVGRNGTWWVTEHAPRVCLIVSESEMRVPEAVDYVIQWVG